MISKSVPDPTTNGAGQSRDVRPRALAVTTVRAQLEDELRRAILSGEFPPGHHLSDRVLQETFQVSRTVVREAVRKLEAEGLLETQPYRGCFVRSVSVEEARQIYDVRCVLEAFAAAGFARNASDSEIESLARVVELFRNEAQNPEPDRLLALKQNFYEVMLRGCGNEYVYRMMDLLLNRNMQLRRVSLSAPDRLKATVSELETLLQAFRNRDPDAAWSATVVHVRNAARIALDKLARDTGLPPGAGAINLPSAELPRSLANSF